MWTLGVLVIGTATLTDCTFEDNYGATSGGAININKGGANSKAWREIWSAGQGIGAIKSAAPAAEWLDWLAADYAAARLKLGLVQ